MKKKLTLVVTATAIALAATVCFFKFTSYGNRILYDVFGGSDLHLVSGKKELYWFDVVHINDPNAPMYKRIENAFTDFNPDYVLVEGGHNTFEGNRDEAIYDGESAFGAYLAKNHGVPVGDIEPPFSSQIEYLQAKHLPDDILAMYLIRQISSMQFADDNSKWDFDQYLLTETRSLIEDGLNYEGETLADILNTVNAFLPKPVNSHNWRDVDIRSVNRVYTQKGGLLYPVYNDVTNFRNIYLVELIKEKKSAHDRIFIVMGGGHIDKTKAQLEKLYS